MGGPSPFFRVNYSSARCQCIHVPQLMHSFKFHWGIALLSKVSLPSPNILQLEYEFQNTKFAVLRHQSIVFKFFFVPEYGTLARVQDSFIAEGVDNEWKWYGSVRDIPHISHVVFFTKENFPMLLNSAKC